MVKWKHTEVSKRDKHTYKYAKFSKLQLLMKLTMYGQQLGSKM